MPTNGEINTLTHKQKQICGHDNAIILYSCAGMNLKLGGGHQSGAKVGGADSAQKKKFRVVPLHFFGSKSTISRFGERSRDGHYSLVSFLFAVLQLTVPPCPAICKSGGHVAPVPCGVGATDTIQDTKCY